MSEREELEKLRKAKRLAELEARHKPQVKPIKQTPEPPSPLVSAGRGMMDIWQGTRQVLPKSFGGYNQQQKADIANNNRIYEEGRNYWHSSKNEKGQMAPDIDGFRIGGQAVATSPLMLIPAGQATAMGRIGTGAIAGGLGGGAIYEEKIEDKMTNTLFGAGAGGAFSGVAPAVAQGAGKAYGMAKEGIRRAGNLFDSFNPKLSGTITNQLNNALTKTGISLNEIGGAAREKLINEANISIKNTGSLDADALVRKYRAESLGFTDDAALTTGQATRDPRVWGKESNIAKGEDEAGSILAGRFENQRAHIKNTFSKWQQEIFGEGANELTPYTVLNNTRASVQNKSSELQKEVSKAYESVPGGVSLNKSALSNRTQQIITDFEDIIPSGVKNRINSIVNNKDRAFIYDDYVKLDQLINQTMGDTRSSATAAAELKKAISGVLDDSGSSLTGDAKAAYTYAKSLAKKRFNQIGEDNRLVGMLNNGKIDDQQFLNKVTKGSSIDEVKNLFGFIDEGSQKQIRTLVLNDIIEQSTKSGNFSQAAYNNYIKKIPKEKLNVIFGNKSTDLINLGKVVEDMYAAPSGHTANFSNSGIEAGNMVRRLYSGLIEGLSPEVRILNAFVSKTPNQSAQNKAVVDLALTSGLPKLPPLTSVQNPIDANTLSRIGQVSPFAGLLPANK